MKIVVNENNIRLDKYLGSCTDYSRSLIEKMLEGNYITVNGNIVKNSYKVSVDDVIEVDENYTKEEVFEASDIPLDVVYEDDYLMVINKASGMVVHPGSGNRSDTLVNALMNHTNELSSIQGAKRAGIVHRLDKDTSGLMLVAKTDAVHEILADAFKNKEVHREYLALIWGVFPSQTAKIDAPIAKSKTDFRMQEVREGGKTAVTNLKVVERFKKYSLVRLSLETGRTHQIRVHLKYIGYPVFNDPVYTTVRTTSFGQFLHSTSIKFIHPITKKEMSFNCEIPTEMKEFIDSLDK